jgi:flavin-dependent dehydrogenase
MRRTPALIIGGGPAGATLALRLAQAGSPHLLLERARETGDALCGGFLSWRTLAMLERLGIEAEALNPAPVRRVRLFARGCIAESALPHPARAVSRRRLDTLLLAAAEKAGAAVERGVAVRWAQGRVSRLADGASIATDALFLATGKHDLRDLARPATARGADPTIGLRVRLQPAAALQRCIGDAIELHLLDRAYAGLVQQEDGAGNLCLAVHRSRLIEAGNSELLLSQLATESPALGERLAHRASSSPIGAIANVPYGWRATSSEEGLFRLGDQAAVIPSLAGEGMAIAIASGLTAAHFYAQGGPAAANAFQTTFAERVQRPINVASAAWRIAERPQLAQAATLLARAIPPLVPLLARLTRIAEADAECPLLPSTLPRRSAARCR